MAHADHPVPVTRPALEVADILRRCAGTYRDTHRLSAQQQRVVNALVNCRTAALGGFKACCEHCGVVTIQYASCRNRHCPKCQTLAQTRWVERQCANLLDIGYWHVVFTLPHELNPLAQGNPALIYRLHLQRRPPLGRTAHARRQLSRRHPRVRVSENRTAIERLGHLHRGAVRRRRPRPRLPRRYTHKSAIANHRLVDFDGEHVRFRWRDYAHGNKRKVMRLDAEEFIRRFLLHVLPRGFTRPRHYGLLGNRGRARKFALCRALLAQPAPEPREPETPQAMMLRLTGIDISVCRQCGRGTLRRILILPSPLPTVRRVGPTRPP